MELSCRSRRLVTSVPRTVFNRLAPRGPRWCYFANHRFRRSTPTDGPDESPVDVTGVRGEEPSSPGTRSLGRDAKAANPCKATVPFPHLKTPPETPLVGKDARNITPPERVGISFR
jgi:hypothetical protein